MNIYENMRKKRKFSEKMGMHTQLLIALEYKTGTKLMLRQSSSTLFKYVNYLIVMSINNNEIIEVRENLLKRKTRIKNKGVYSYLRILLPSCLTFK